MNVQRIELSFKRNRVIITKEDGSEIDITKKSLMQRSVEEARSKVSDDSVKSSLNKKVKALEKERKSSLGDDYEPLPQSELDKLGLNQQSEKNRHVSDMLDKIASQRLTSIMNICAKFKQDLLKLKI